MQDNAILGNRERNNAILRGSGEKKEENCILGHHGNGKDSHTTELENVSTQITPLA